MLNESALCHECGRESDTLLCSSCTSREKAEQYYAGAQATRNALKEALEIPSCTTCKHGSWDEDMSVGIPFHLEDCAFLPPEVNWDDVDNDDQTYKKLAILCGQWTLDPSKIGPTW